MAITDKKTALRIKLSRNRMELSDNDVADLSDKIISKLIDHILWEEIETLHIYRPISSKNEVNTSLLIDWIDANHPKIEVIFAPINMPFYLPVNNTYDLVIVPVLGFDRSGNRLGYGGGYYDRLLSRNNCKNTIGLAYSFCEVDEIPVKDHDQKLDKIITEKEII